jgi:hypothetical protein
MTRLVGLRVLAAATLIAAAAVVCRAKEVPVGLEAQGLDAQAALESPADLDLRDELGRPVCPKLVEKQLKAAAAEAAAEAAFSSRLPQARFVVGLLELWEGLKAAFGSPGRNFPHRVYAATSPRPAPRMAVLHLTLSSAALPSSVLPQPDCSSLPRAFAGALLALRC